MINKKKQTLADKYEEDGYKGIAEFIRYFGNNKTIKIMPKSWK